MLSAAKDYHQFQQHNVVIIYCHYIWQRSSHISMKKMSYIKYLYSMKTVPNSGNSATDEHA